jgi:hypothetical protein
MADRITLNGMRNLLSILLLLFEIQSVKIFSQFPVEIGYNRNWNFIGENHATYIRSGNWSYKDNFFTGKFTDRLADTTIIITEGYFQDGAKHGYFREFYDDGRLKSHGMYQGNSKQGIWEYYDRFGVLTHVIRHDSIGFEFVRIHPRFVKKGLFKREKVSFWKYETNHLNTVVILGVMKNGENHGKWTVSVNGDIFLTEKYRTGKFLYSTLYQGGFPMRDKQSYLPAILNTDVYLDVSGKLTMPYRETGKNEYAFLYARPGMKTDYVYEGVMDDSIIGEIIPPVYPEGYRRFRTFMNERIRCFVPSGNPVPQELMLTVYIDTSGTPYRFDFREPIDEECRQKVISKILAMKKWYPAATREKQLINSRIVIYLDCDIVRSSVSAE